MKKVFCFGEILLRMSPDINGEWIKNSSMSVYLGGAELNVANSLAKWNIPVQYCSAAADNYLSKSILASLQQKCIDISKFIFCGDRIGAYYLAQGTDLKNAGVIYDRAHSSFGALQPGTINWNEMLKDADWFHFSAISPALNENVVAVCKEALEVASKKGITISVDLNYRAKLWQYGKQPKHIMPELVQHCNIVMGNIWSAESLLGIKPNAELLANKNKESYLQAANESAVAVLKQFSSCKIVANTFRFDNGDGINYYAAANEGSEQFVSKEFYVDKVVDKVGTGDCFMAGLIYGNQNNLPLQRTINFAASAAVGKTQVIGDATTETIDDVFKRMNE
jgi:2-dehydro-3-deoxygluconokinase